LQRIEDQRNRLLSTYAPLAARIEIVPRDAVERMVRENEEQIAALERDLELPPGG
jgi:bacterioferritin (cytochrome b1)